MKYDQNMKMKVLLLIIFFIAGFAQARQSFTKEQQAAQQTVIQLFDALSNRDATALRNHSTADVLFLEYGKVWTIDTLINLAITKNTTSDFKRINKLDFVNTVVKGDVAWLTYYLQSDFSSDGKNSAVHWMETVVLVKKEKQWKVNVLHSTRIK